MNSLTEKEQKITVIPTVCPVYSLGIFSAGAAPLLSVRVGGLCVSAVSKISINVYGLSKAGFFIERSKAFSGEIMPDDEDDGVTFDFCDVPLSVKREFLCNLKAPVTGKICVEATVNGVKYMGDAPVQLLPAKVYPSAAAPLVFSSFLTPYAESILKITENCKDKLSDIYDAIRAQRIVYSVRECDFVLRDVPFEIPDAILEKRSRMASPLEMALIFCSCALSAKLYPVIAVIKGKKGPRVFCGISNKKGVFGNAVTCSVNVLSSLMANKSIELFDVSCLFTGHSVELCDAQKKAAEEISSGEVIFALDIMYAYTVGTALSFDSEKHPEFEKTVSAYASCGKKEERDLSYFAEKLCGSEDSELLNFGLLPSLPVKFADFSAIPDVAFSDDSRIILADILQEGALNEFSNIRKIAEKLIDSENGELYLACGSLRSDSLCAPLALYPVKLQITDQIIYFEFLSPKPYFNRLLCEKLKMSREGKKFFEDYGVPASNFESIRSCFESFCSAVSGYSIKYDCALKSLSYKDSALSFYIIDRHEKIAADEFSRKLLSHSGDRKEYMLADMESAAAKIAYDAPAVFSQIACTAAAASCDADIMVHPVSFDKQSEICAAVSCENMKKNKTTLVVSDNHDERRAVLHEFKKLGLDNAVLVLSEKSDIKESIRKKLISLSQIPVPLSMKYDSDEIKELREKFEKYDIGKKCRYSFDFSFDEAAKAYINAGASLTSEEKALCLEPDGIFFPEMSRSTTEAVFSAVSGICRAALKLGATEGISAHPLFAAKGTEIAVDEKAFNELYAECEKDLEELTRGCEKIAESVGFDLSCIKNLPAVHSFLSLAVLISKEYSTDITDALLKADIYSVSKKAASLRSIASKIEDIENQLCGFERSVYDLCAKDLLDEYNGVGKGDLSRSDIIKTINSHQKDDAAEASKKNISEILSLLWEREEQKLQFDSESEGMDELFAATFEGVSTDFGKITKFIDFVKMADILLKKIHGTDQDARHETASKFGKAWEFCSDKVNMASVIGAAGVFDRMFSDIGCVAALSKMVSADLYNTNFEEGVLSQNGIAKMISDWQSSYHLLPYMAEYNKKAAECEAFRLSCFVKYLENNRCTENTEKIFIRSLLFLALKQISINDKVFLSMNSYESDVSRFALLLKEKTVQNLNARKLSYVESCVTYINSNKEKAQAFSDSLGDKKCSAEELLLRHGDSIKKLFPVIVAEPYYAGFLSDFENVIVCSADMIHTSKILPVLCTAQRKLVLSGEFCRTSDCFAADCVNANMGMMPLYDGGQPTMSQLCSERSVEFLRSPVSSFDKEQCINVLEAQTIGLEIMKELEKDSELRIGVLAFSKNQCHALHEVLLAVAEKSENVAKALAASRIDVDYIGKKRKGMCDILYVSTVFGKDDASGSCISFPAADDATVKFIAGFEYAARAIQSSGERLVVVSCADGKKYPETVASHGALKLHQFINFAANCGKTVSAKYEDSDKVYDIYLAEFCRIMSDNGIPVKTVRNRSYAAVTAGEKTYAAIIGNEAFCAHERSKLKRAGFGVVYIDKCELAMNPQKVIDRIKDLEEENA